MRNKLVILLSCCTILLLFLPNIASAQTPPAWQPGVAYAVGALVTYNGVVYQCIQAHTSEVGWEPPNVPALWQPVSSSTTTTTCSAGPSSPMGLTASGTTSNGTTLNWSASTVPTGCSVTSYTIFQNGAQIGTATGTGFTVTGLAASTAYSFAVSSSDSAGSSAQSAAIGVTTQASSSGGSGCAAAWSSTAVYTAGMTASVGGINYQANWWTQGQNPATNNGGSGSGQPWTSLGPCTACSTVPTAPAGLSASGTTGSSTTLSWSASSVASNCSITGYTVFKNGTAVGTATGTTFVVTGLSPSTQYTFTVAANDSAGSSGQSNSISVTTTAGGNGGGNSGMYAPYIDMSLTADEQLLTIQQQSGIKFFTLAFIVDNGNCQASWGGLGQTLPNDSEPNGTTISSLIQGVRAAGGDVIISFGGANGNDISSACTSASQVQAMYQSVVSKYNPRWLDFDIEGGNVSNTTTINLRNQALIALKAANPGLVISYTLPVLPTGLVSTGVAILNSVKSSGLSLNVVNVMAMDYGSANDNGGQMGLDATQAASNTHSQVLAAGLNSSIGVTPMIGVNDTNTEIFQLSDAQTVLNFALSNSYITRIAIWSVARDNGSCAGAGFASPTCSAISQGNYAFSQIFEAF